MSFKQEAIAVLNFYKRNMAHILGEEDERVKVIERCIGMVDEIEDMSEDELKFKLEEAYAHGYTEAEAQMHDKLKELSIKMARGTSRNGMAMQLMAVDYVTEGKRSEE